MITITTAGDIKYFNYTGIRSFILKLVITLLIHFISNLLFAHIINRNNKNTTLSHPMRVHLFFYYYFHTTTVVIKIEGFCIVSDSLNVTIMTQYFELVVIS